MGKPPFQTPPGPAAQCLPCFLPPSGNILSTPAPRPRETAKLLVSGAFEILLLGTYVQFGSNKLL